MPDAMFAIMPTVFVSHGAPTLSLDEGPARTFLLTLGSHLPRPRAILCVSAHWDKAIPAATGTPRPETIHDFFGFPEALYQLLYRGIEYGMLSMAAYGWFPPTTGAPGRKS
jgi:4,5-DOPA dioxygenase extradiol